MKIQYFSDIHIEFFKDVSELDKTISKIKCEADICV